MVTVPDRMENVDALFNFGGGRCDRLSTSLKSENNSVIAYYWATHTQQNASIVGVQKNH